MEKRSIITSTVLFLAIVLSSFGQINIGVYPDDIQGNSLRVNVTLTPVSPLPRVNSTNVFSMQPITRTTSTNGTYVFTNILYGIYTLTIQGNPPSVYQLVVGTNLSGTVAVPVLVTNLATNVPPDPTTN